MGLAVLRTLRERADHYLEKRGIEIKTPGQLSPKREA